MLLVGFAAIVAELRRLGVRRADEKLRRWRRGDFPAQVLRVDGKPVPMIVSTAEDVAAWVASAPAVALLPRRLVTANLVRVHRYQRKIAAGLRTVRDIDRTPRDHHACPF